MPEIEKNLESVASLLMEASQDEKEVKEMFSNLMEALIRKLGSNLKIDDLEIFKVECTFNTIDYRKIDDESAIAFIYYTAVLTSYPGRLDITIYKEIEYFNDTELEPITLFRITMNSQGTVKVLEDTIDIEQAQYVIDNLDKIIECWKEELEKRIKPLKEIKEKLSAIKI